MICVLTVGKLNSDFHIQPVNLSPFELAYSIPLMLGVELRWSVVLLSSLSPLCFSVTSERELTQKDEIPSGYPLTCVIDKPNCTLFLTHGVLLTMKVLRAFNELT